MLANGRNLPSGGVEVILYTVATAKLNHHLDKYIIAGAEFVNGDNLAHTTNDEQRYNDNLAAL